MEFTALCLCGHARDDHWRGAAVDHLGECKECACYGYRPCTFPETFEPVSFPQIADHKIIGLDDLDAYMDEFDE